MAPAPDRLAGVIPAAGHAVRLQPLACSKEVVPIGGRPVMDHLIERMRAAGASELRVVTRPDKRDVIANAEHHGAEVILASPRSISESLAAGMNDLPDDAIVLFGFPDTIWDPLDGFARLMAALKPPCDVALGLFRWDEPERSDVITLSDDGLVAGLAVKRADAPGSLIWGCGGARVDALRGIERSPDPGHFLDSLCRRRPVAGIYLSDSYVDIGTREALAAAVRTFGESPP